jgi:hypothetical protein
MRKIWIGIAIGVLGLVILEVAGLVVFRVQFPLAEIVLHSDTLLREIAQRALDRVAFGSGTATVTNINTVPVLGQTQVDIQLNNCSYTESWSGRNMPKIYTGRRN